MNNKVFFFALTMLLSANSCIVYGNEEERNNKITETQQENMAPEQHVAVEFFVLSINKEEAKKLNAIINLDVYAKNFIETLPHQIDKTTPISLGNQVDIAALVKELEALNVAKVVANPYLIASNNKKASITTGETRHIATSSQDQDFATTGDKSANSSIELTPTINNDGTITLDLDITIEKFINSSETTQRTISSTIHTTHKELLLFELPFEDESTGYKENLLMFVSSNLIQARSC